MLFPTDRRMKGSNDEKRVQHRAASRSGATAHVRMDEAAQRFAAQPRRGVSHGTHTAVSVVEAVMRKRDLQEETAFLVALAEHGLPANIGEELIGGCPALGVPPGALRKALDAAWNTRQAAAPSSDLAEEFWTLESRANGCSIPEGARLALRHFVNHAPWFETVDAISRCCGGKMRPFRWTVGWLVAHGYAFRQIQPQRADGTRPFDRFVLTKKERDVKDRAIAGLRAEVESLRAIAQEQSK